MRFTGDVEQVQYKSPLLYCRAEEGDMVKATELALTYLYNPRHALKFVWPIGTG